MYNQLPTIRLVGLIGTEGVQVFVENSPLVYAQTGTTTPTSATNAIPVQNTDGFTPATGSNYRILLNDIGTETAEIVTATSISSNTLVLSSNTTQAHSRGEPVKNIIFDQIEISKASALGGSYSVLTTIAIQPTTSESLYVDTASPSSTAAYKVRFKNSISGLYSDYSAAASLSQVSSAYDSIAVASTLINSVRLSTGNKDLPDSFFLEALNDAREIIEFNILYGKPKEWRHMFEFPIQMYAGRNYIPLPSDTDFKETNRSLLAARYSREVVGSPQPIRYVDKKDWNAVVYQNRVSTNTTQALSGATSIVLENAGDFPTAGTVVVSTNAFTESILYVTFTGKTGNTLTGVSGLTRTIAAGTQIWSYQANAYPYNYSVFDLYLNGVKTPSIVFDRPIPQALQGKNCYIDYYKAYTKLTSIQDQIPEHFRDIYKNYLKFAIKRRRDETIGEDDPDYKLFMDAAKNIVTGQYNGQYQTIVQD